MKALPAGAEVYQRTPEFSQTSVPPGLLKSHRTKAGSWGRIVVLEGRLRYRILEPEFEEFELAPGVPGIIEPGVAHEVAIVGAVRFYVEFLRTPGA